MMNTIAPYHPSPIIPDEFPILGSGMNHSIMLPTSPNYYFDQRDDQVRSADERLISHYLINEKPGNKDQVNQLPEIDILDYELLDLLLTHGVENLDFPNPTMDPIVPHPPPNPPDQFPILGSGMNHSNLLPTSPNYSFIGDEEDNKFRPSDERLISHYLNHKIQGNEDKVIRIPEIDILTHEPWDLLPIDEELRYKEAYYFWPREGYFTSKGRYKRTTGSGYWKPTGKHREIRSSRANGEVIGTKRTLVFHYGRPAGQTTCYTMHEYSATNSVARQPLREDLVLCKIMKKVSNRSKKTKTTATKLPSETKKKKRKAAISPMVPSNENINTTTLPQLEEEEEVGSKKKKAAAMMPIIPSNENISATTLPRQEEEEEEVSSYLVASDFGNQNEAFSNGGRVELSRLHDGDDDHSPLPDFDLEDFDFVFDFEPDSAVGDKLPPPELSEHLLGKFCGQASRNIKYVM